MVTMEIFNKVVLSIDSVTGFVHLFNNCIDEYGVIKVVDVANLLMIKYEDDFRNYAYGWTEHIDGNEHIELHYPDCKLRLPDYKPLISKEEL